jgi:membrane dipeptidase
VDVSHASDPLFYDVAALAKKPIIATHSNARQICSHPRNLTDEQFAFIRDRGGLVGLNLHRWFVREDGQATLDDLFRHVYHFLSLGGEETLCLGTDFDGADVVPEIKNLTEMTHLYDYFCKMRLPEDIIDRIFYKNGKDFMDSL